MQTSIVRRLSSVLYLSAHPTISKQLRKNSKAEFIDVRPDTWLFLIQVIEAAQWRSRNLRPDIHCALASVSFSCFSSYSVFRLCGVISAVKPARSRPGTSYGQSIVDIVSEIQHDLPSFRNRWQGLDPPYASNSLLVITTGSFGSLPSLIDFASSYGTS